MDLGWQLCFSLINLKDLLNLTWYTTFLYLLVKLFKALTSWWLALARTLMWYGLSLAITHIGDSCDIATSLLECALLIVTAGYHSIMPRIFFKVYGVHLITADRHILLQLLGTRRWILRRRLITAIIFILVYVASKPFVVWICTFLVMTNPFSLLID